MDYKRKRIKNKATISKKRNIEGFTLIELLVVISIISFIFTISLVALNGARVKARTAKRLADLRTVKTALDIYYDDNKSYPSSLGGVGVWDGLYTCWGDSSDNWILGLVSTYMSKLPRDPRNNTNCDEQYVYRSDGIDYKLLSIKPEDCSGVQAQYPSIIDPIRLCTPPYGAYGFWTPGARNW